MLSIDEIEELKTLRALQKRTDRFLSQEEYSRIDYLQSKQHDHHCMDPHCEGGRFPDETNCPDCGRLLHIHKRPTFTVDGIDRRNELYLTIHQPGYQTTI